MHKIIIFRLLTNYLKYMDILFPSYEYLNIAKAVIKQTFKHPTSFLTNEHEGHDTNLIFQN